MIRLQERLVPSTIIERSPSIFFRGPAVPWAKLSVLFIPLGMNSGKHLVSLMGIVLTTLCSAYCATAAVFHIFLQTHPNDILSFCFGMF
jgi:hypothetical protein